MKNRLLYIEKRVVYGSVGISLIVAFLLFSKYIKQGNMKHFDFATTVRLQNHIPARFDQIMDDGAILADPFVSGVIVLFITGWLFIRVKGKRKLFVLGIPFAFVLVALVELYGKNFVPHAGPPFFMVKHPTTIFPQFTVIQPYSYPSGHAARITFLAIFCLFLIRRAVLSQKRRNILLLSSLMVMYVGFVFISRIYLGHHWLSDIVGGFLLGGGLSVLVSAFTI